MTILHTNERTTFLAAAGSGAAAWFGFSAFPPMQVRVGRDLVNEWVPPHYQAAAFPAFGALLYTLWNDRHRRNAPWVGRLAILAATSTVAITRLAGLHPLSGHAVFLAAVATFECPPFSPNSPPQAHKQTPQSTRPTIHRSPTLFMSAALGLAITAVYKVKWEDTIWGTASVAAGVAIGACARRVAAT
ncbi:MAG: hypothetical protein IPK82_07060 [Polyangiaceae bacterium]|nr:hypothetical protein [Polyangiaceae bacterium]